MKTLHEEGLIFLKFQFVLTKLDTELGLFFYFFSHMICHHTLFLFLIWFVLMRLNKEMKTKVYFVFKTFLRFLKAQDNTQGTTTS